MKQSFLNRPGWIPVLTVQMPASAPGRLDVATAAALQR